MEELIKILEEFDTKRDDYKKDAGKKWDEDAVANCFFEACAKQILCKGYFLINGRYIIDLGRIELYYDEEGDGKDRIKDPIMYHTNDKIPYSTHYKEIGKYPYFKFGSFNLHQSGVDVTFEKPDPGKEYRASFLIRSYRVIEKEDNETLENVKSKLNNLSEPKFDPHSTHIFDDMFPNGIMFGDNKDIKIEWIPCVKDGEVEPCKRINVAECEMKEVNGVKKFIKKEIKKKEYDTLSDADKCNYKYKGKENNETCYYKEESRNWGFKRIGIIEHK